MRYQATRRKSPSHHESGRRLLAHTQKLRIVAVQGLDVAKELVRLLRCDDLKLVQWPGKSGVEQGRASAKDKAIQS